jgi:hypothetical protein
MGRSIARSMVRLGTVISFACIGALTACELIVDVDRDKLPARPIGTQATTPPPTPAEQDGGGDAGDASDEASTSDGGSDGGPTGVDAGDGGRPDGG